VNSESVVEGFAYLPKKTDGRSNSKREKNNAKRDKQNLADEEDGGFCKTRQKGIFQNTEKLT